MKILGSFLIFTLSVSRCLAAGEADQQAAKSEAATIKGVRLHLAVSEFYINALKEPMKDFQDLKRKIEGEAGQQAPKSEAATIKGVRLALAAAEFYINILREPIKDFQDLKRKIEAMDPGETYTRWGRDDCPDSAELVYDGYAGGSWYDHSGSAADYICLSRHPKYLHVTQGFNKNGGLVYGAEYETTKGNPIWNDTMQNYNVPCAVCRTNRSSVLMIPGTYECESSGWTREYYGYLSSGKWNQQSGSEFVCMDINPEMIGDVANQDGKLFYLVKGVCGSLPCKPENNEYVNEAEFTCVVCSK